MDRQPPATGAVPAGVASGLAALAAFLVVHAAWIVPIWFIAPVGALLAAAGGAAIGAAYRDLLARLPRSRTTRFVVVAAAVSSVVVTGVVVAELRGPLPAATGAAGIMALSFADVAGDLAVYAGLASMIGAAGGWLLAGRRAARSCAIAAFAIAVGPGHNIPALGGTAAVPKELLMLSVVTVTAAAVLVGGEAMLAGRQGRPEAALRDESSASPGRSVF